MTGQGIEKKQCDWHLECDRPHIAGTTLLLIYLPRFHPKNRKNNTLALTTICPSGSTGKAVTDRACTQSETDLGSIIPSVVKERGWGSLGGLQTSVNTSLQQ